jgi:hypothetical protein
MRARDPLDAAQIATLVSQPGASNRLEQLTIALANDPAANSDTLNQLLRWRDSRVRFWALGAAERIYPRGDYIRVLKAAMRDPDEAVRDDAIGRLADLAPEDVRPLAKSLASRLGGQIPSGEKGFILWTLAKIRALEATQQILDLRSQEPDWTQLARVADVVLLYLTEGEQAILDKIRHHGDHKRMEELCTLAWHVLGTTGASAALIEAEAHAPDDECRQRCREALRRLGS